MGMRVYDVYRDEGISGKTVKRPELQRLLNDTAAGAIQKVVTLKLDRISRNVRDMLNITEELEKHGVAFICVRDNIDTSSAAGKLMRTVLAAIAEFESDIAGERTYAAKHELTLQGRYAGGNIPFGYDYDKGDRAFVVNEAEAAIVERVFGEYLNGATTYKIAQQLNKEGIPTKRGGRWQAVQVDLILRNVFYTGQLHWIGIIYNGSHAAIIADRLFNKVQRKLNAASSSGQRASNAF